MYTLDNAAPYMTFNFEVTQTVKGVQYGQGINSEYGRKIALFFNLYCMWKNSIICSSDSEGAIWSEYSYIRYNQTN